MSTFMSRIHLDPTVSVGHLLTTMGLLVAGLWWAAEIYTRVEVNATNITTNASNISSNSSRIEQNQVRALERVRQAEELAERGRIENREYLQRIEDKLDRLIESQANL